MNSLQKMGSVAALVMAATFVVGLAVFLGVLTPAGYFEEGVTPVEKVAILANNHAIAFAGIDGAQPGDPNTSGRTSDVRAWTSSAFGSSANASRQPRMADAVSFAAHAAVP